jgi:hypothetical protein
VQVLAALLSLLATARYQPAGHISFGNRCVERLLRLSQAGRLQLRHFGDVVSSSHCPNPRSTLHCLNLCLARGPGKPQPACQQLPLTPA